MLRAIGKPAALAGFFVMMLGFSGKAMAQPLRSDVFVSVQAGMGMGFGFGEGTDFIVENVIETGSASAGVSEVYPWRFSVSLDWFFSPLLGCGLDVSALNSSFAGVGLDSAGMVRERREYSYVGFCISPSMKARYKIGPGTVLADTGVLAVIPFLDGAATIRNSAVQSIRAIPVASLPALPFGLILSGGYAYPLGPGSITGKLRNELRWSTSYGNGTDQLDVWAVSSTVMLGYSLRLGK